MLDCFVLMASFCFSGHQIDMRMNDFGLGYTATVTAETYKAELSGGDVLIMHDFRKAPQACVDKTCVRYFKICTDDPIAPVRCEYRITWPDLIADGGIVITANSRDALAVAEKEIQKIIYSKDGEGKIPLSLLTMTSAASDLRDCPNDVTAAQCNPA